MSRRINIWFLSMVFGLPSGDLQVVRSGTPGFGNGGRCGGEQVLQANAANIVKISTFGMVYLMSILSVVTEAM